MRDNFCTPCLSRGKREKEHLYDLKQAKELSRFFNISLDDLTGDSTFEYLGGNNSIFGGNNTFLGWYENGEELKKEIVAIKEAMSLKEKSYELKYNVEVEKQLLGMKLKIKK